MRNRLSLAAVLLVAVTVLASVEGQQASGEHALPRTPWGDPDIQGVFTTDDELGVPFERPEAAGERTVVTDAEFVARQAQAQRRNKSEVRSGKSEAMKWEVGSGKFEVPRGGESRSSQGVAGLARLTDDFSRSLDDLPSNPSNDFDPLLPSYFQLPTSPLLTYYF